MSTTTARLGFAPGSHINKAIASAIQAAAEMGHAVAFDFNEVEVTVLADSDPALIRRDWSRAMSGYIDRAVGPHPAVELSSAELAHDAEVEAENEARRRAASEAYEAEQRSKAERAAAETAGCAFTFAPGGMELWAKGLDAQESAYGKACFTYAERWGRLMEARMAAGAVLADVVEQASHDADVEGITGFMHGCAVSILVETWKHGEALRQLRQAA